MRYCGFYEFFSLHHKGWTLSEKKMHVLYMCTLLINTNQRIPKQFFKTFFQIFRGQKI